jgi:hypothetical protein
MWCAMMALLIVEKGIRTVVLALHLVLC